ncbi:MAG: hypothetical protein Fur0040_00350 [Sideroxydans sp.]
MIGYLAVPLLFQNLDRQLAGLIAGRMFATLNYIGFVCGLYLLAYRWRLTGGHILYDRAFHLIATMLAITLAIQFGLQPLMADMKLQALPLEVMQSPYAGQFKMWHGLSSILYLIESLLGAALIVLTCRAAK